MRHNPLWQTLLLVLPILMVLGLAVYYLLFAWSIGGHVAIGAAGWIAMALGVVFTLGLTAVLVMLLLHRGPDEE
jgi:hypothetical protein